MMKQEELAEQNSFLKTKQKKENGYSTKTKYV